jgi:hypothetical protein
MQRHAHFSAHGIENRALHQADTEVPQQRRMRKIAGPSALALVHRVPEVVKGDGLLRDQRRDARGVLDYGQHVQKVLLVRAARILREPLRRQAFARKPMRHLAIHLHFRLHEQMRHGCQRRDPVAERNSRAHRQHAKFNTKYTQAGGRHSMEYAAFSPRGNPRCNVFTARTSNLPLAEHLP